MYLGNNLQAAYSNYQLIDSLTASFNGTTTSFPLRVNGVTPVPFPLNEQNVLISVGGVPQKPDATGAEGFRFSGSNIVFSSAPKTGEAFWGVILAGADYVNVGVNYPDGSASVPSITFGSEKTTGFYRLGSGSIGVTLTGVVEASFSGSGFSLYGSTSGTTTLAAPAVAGNNVLTLPTGNGTNGQVLQTNGSGSLSWANGATTGPAFSAWASTATNTPTATFTKVVLVSEEFDTANCYDGNARFTPNVAGYYLITGAVSYGASTQITSIFKNGSEFKRGTQSVGGTMTLTNVSALIYLNGTTDYVELYWYQATGATVNNATGQAGTYFQGFLARPA